VAVCKGSISTSTVKTLGHGSGCPNDYDKSLNLAFSFECYKSLTSLCRIPAIEALKTRDIRFTPENHETNPENMSFSAYD
jgi:hypothetical protein